MVAQSCHAGPLGKFWERPICNLMKPDLKILEPLETIRFWHQSNKGGLVCKTWETFDQMQCDRDSM